MKLSTYTVIWALIFLLLGFEYYALNRQPSFSLLMGLQNKGLIRSDLKLSTEPGRPLSLWLGWFGLGLMLIMNLYSLRKRVEFLRNWGKLSTWLNFHVFCGLVGPTLILFHCNLKVRGIVAISFWSMVVSFSSGIIGRYFYVQLLMAKSDLEAEVEKRLQRLRKILEKAKSPIPEAELQSHLKRALKYVGVSSSSDEINPLGALMRSVIGDLKLLFSLPQIPTHWPKASKLHLTGVAVSQRRALFLTSFQRLMGYWHTFHFPFAVFMYLAAVIHVVAALVFGI